MKSQNWRNRWRKGARKRGVSPIIATILLVAITVVRAAVLYILISGLTKGPGTTPLGAEFGFGTLSEFKAGTTYYYNFTGVTGGGGLTLNNLQFQVKNTGNAIVVPTTLKVFSALSPTVALATWTFASSAWSGNPTLAVNSTMTFSVTSTFSLSGGTIYAFGVNGFSSQVSTSIA